MKCEWAKNFANDTWNRICMSRQYNGFKIYETTITQNMIYSLLFNKIDGIKIYESIDEARNGNDLEVFLESDNNNFCKFAVQSKIVYKNGKYDTIQHYNEKVKNYQIEVLLNYARRKKSIPIYFFYSYDSAFNGNNNYGIPYKDFGVTVFSAHKVFLDYYDYFKKKWKKIPTTKNILTSKYSISFSQFICNSNSLYNLEQLVFEPKAYLGIQKGIEEYYCNINEIINNPEWIEIQTIERRERETLLRNDNNENNFNPKFRLIYFKET